MNSYKKGVALIWSLVLSAVLLLISGTMVSYIVKESQFSVKITDSAKAYTYAKSGVEWANQNIADRNNQSPPQSPEVTDYIIDLNNDSTPEIRITISGCVANPVTGIYESCIIESTGISQEVTRKLEYQMIPTELKKVTPSLLGSTELGTNTESFVLQFDLWSEDSTPEPLTIGVDNSSGGYLGFRLESSGQTAAVYQENSSTAEIVEIIGNIDLDEITQPYGHRVILKYIDDTAFQVTINKYSNGIYECLYKKVVDIASIDFGDLNSLYLSGSGATYNPGENDYIAIGDSRIDNLYSSTEVPEVIPPSNLCTSFSKPDVNYSRYTSTASISILDKEKVPDSTCDINWEKRDSLGNLESSGTESSTSFSITNVSSGNILIFDAGSHYEFTCDLLSCK